MAAKFSYMRTLVSTSMLITTLFVLLFFIIIIVNRSQTKSRNEPPGSFGWPVLGETREYLGTVMSGKPHDFIKERLEKYKSQVFKTSLMGQPVAVLCGPSANKFLFSNENKLVTVWWPSSVRKILGKCIATTSGVEGVLMRRMVTYFVSPDAFTKLYIKKMDMVAHQRLRIHWEGKEVVKVFPCIRLFTFEIACRLFMGIEDRRQIAKIASLYDIFVKGVISIPLDFPGTRFYKAKKATNAIRRELEMIIKERRVALEHKTATSSQDMLSHLLANTDEDGGFVSESVIINNILLVLFAGHDTSSLAITMLIKYLAEFPHVYEKVLREQNEIGLLKQGREFLEWEDLKMMKYSWNVACEVMRLSPPLLGAFREAVVDIKYGGYDIPKGWKATLFFIIFMLLFLAERSHTIEI